jgi:hypothetical protein
VEMYIKWYTGHTMEPPNISTVTNFLINQVGLPANWNDQVKNRVCTCTNQCEAQLTEEEENMHLYTAKRRIISSRRIRYANVKSNLKNNSLCK